MARPRSRIYRPLVPIHEILHRFPGGNIIIPLIIGCLIKTIASACGHPDIWAELGDPMETMFSGRAGLLAFIGLMIFFTGTQTDVTKLKPMLKRGVPLLFVRLGFAYAISFIFLAIFGQDGVGGVSFLGLTAGLTCINSAMFMSVTNGYADDADRAYFSLAMVFGLPVLPLLAVRGGTGASINYLSIVSIIVPLIFGIVLGNLDRKMRKFYQFGTQVIVMFMGFQFGSYIDLTQAFKQIPQALILVLVLYLTCLPSLLIERFWMKRSGYATLGMSALAGVSLSMPVLTSDIFSPQVTTDATYQLAFALAVTAILAPLLTDWANRAFFQREPELLKLSNQTLYDHVNREMEEKAQRREMKYFKKLTGQLTAAQIKALPPEDAMLVYTSSAKDRKFELQRIKKDIADLPVEEQNRILQQHYDDVDHHRTRLSLVTFKVSRARTRAVHDLLQSGEVKAEEIDCPILDIDREQLAKKRGVQLSPLSSADRLDRLLALYKQAEFAIDMEEARSYIDSRLV